MQTAECLHKKEPLACIAKKAAFFEVAFGCAQDKNRKEHKGNTAQKNTKFYFVRVWYPGGSLFLLLKKILAVSRLVGRTIG